MRILYVWDKDLPAWRSAYLDATEALYPDAEYLCITKESYFRGYTVIPWDEIGEALMRTFHFKEWPYRWNHPLVFSDWARFWFLGNCWDTLYLDTDAKMLERIELGERVRYSPGDTHVLYSPPSGESRHFLTLLHAQATPVFHHTIVNRFTSDWSEPLPRTCYFHGRP